MTSYKVLYRANLTDSFEIYRGSVGELSSGMRTIISDNSITIESAAETAGNTVIGFSFIAA